MTDTDPKHEVGDVPSPCDRLFLPPDTDASADEVDKAEHHESRQDDGRNHEQPPQQWLLVLNDSADAVRDPGVGTMVKDERLAVQDARGTRVSF